MSQDEGGFRLSQDLLTRIESALTQHRTFIRRARDRAQKMLFFFGLSRPTSDPRVDDAVRRYRDHCRRWILELGILVAGHGEEVDDLLDDLAAALDPTWRTRPENWLQHVDQLEPWLAEVDRHAVERGLYWNKNWRSARRDLLELWRCRQELGIWEPLSEVGALESPEDWTAARGAVERFLAFEGGSVLHRLIRERRGRTGRSWKLIQGLRNLPGWAYKHLALLPTAAIAIYVVSQIEAVHSLIRNMGGWAAIPFVLALLPLLASKGWVWWRYRGREEVPAWDVGGVPHRSLRRLARAPERLVERWPPSAAQTGSGTLDVKSFGRSSRDSLRELRARGKKPRSILDVIVKGQLKRLLGYVLAWLVGSLALWGLVRAGVVSSTYLTVFLIVVILYTLVLAARLIDFWDFLEPKPIRRHLLLYATVGIVALLQGWGFPFFIAAFLAWAAWFFWTFLRRPGRPLRLVFACGSSAFALLLVLLWVTRERGVWEEPAESNPWRGTLQQELLEEPPEPPPAPLEWPLAGDEPLVMMAASGGGSRAALYAALTLDRLERTRVECTDGADACALGEHLQAISSVSGGSLATAGYVARRLAEASGATLDEELTDAVSGDFLLPTLWGALNPFLSRGDAIERQWQGLGDLVRDCPGGKEARWRAAEPPSWGRAGVALGDLCLSDLAAAWRQAGERGARRPPFPMPLFNSSTLDGHDLVITPLPREFYTSRRFADEARDPDRNLYDNPASTWVYYRDAIYGLEDLLGSSFDPPLSSAVRASANFPFGFPLVELETRRPLFLRPGWRKHCREEGEEVMCKQKTVRLTDGGALSNSGLWPLFQLLVNRADELRRRGVLLIVVDASKMATPGDTEKAYLGLQGTIGDQAPIGQYLHRTMFDLLERIYGGGIAIQQIDLEPLEESNVHTTWAFDPGTRERLEGIFERRWDKLKGPLVAKWDHLWRRAQHPDPEALAAPAELIDRARPPAD